MKKAKSRLNKKGKKHFNNLLVFAVVFGLSFGLYLQKMALDHFVMVDSLGETNVQMFKFVASWKKEAQIWKQKYEDLAAEKHMTQKQEIMMCIIEVFGEDADDAIAVIGQCENSDFNPNAINKGNNNGTWDVGIFQMNVDPNNTEEVEKLKDFKYNVDQAKKKFDAKGSFYYWTCGHVVGHRTYVDALNGR